MGRRSVRIWWSILTCVLVMTLGQSCRKQLQGTQLNEAIAWEEASHTAIDGVALRTSDLESEREADTLVHISVKVLTPNLLERVAEGVPKHLLDSLQHPLYESLLYALGYDAEEVQYLLTTLEEKAIDLPDVLPDWVEGSATKHWINAQVEADIQLQDIPDEAARKSSMPWLFALEQKITDSMTYNQHGFISIERYQYAWTGGIHGMSSSEPFNFDLAHAVRLTLADIFLDPMDSNLLALVEAEFLKLYEAENLHQLQEVHSLFVLNPEDRGEGVFIPERFLFTEEGITLIYGEYEIGPYAIGMPRVTLPYAKVKPFLKKTIQQQLVL